MTKWKPIVCIDFDGVIHSYKSGWNGIDIIPDPPVEGIFEDLKEYLKHFKVHIYSSRSSSRKGIHAMIEWFIEHGFEDVDELTFPTQKPPAFITIDDRAIQFNGVLPKPEEIKEFNPWFKR